MSPPFAENAGPFLPTTPLSDEEAGRQYKTGKRRTLSYIDAADRFAAGQEAELKKQIETSERLKTGRDVKAKYGNISPTDLALGGAGPPSKEAVKEAAGYAGQGAKEWFGDTPLDWAANSLMGPGKLPVRLARAAVISSLHTPEAEGVLLNLTSRAPARFDKALEVASKLKGGRNATADEIFQATKGQLTLSPQGHFEGIYRPDSWDITNLTRDKKPLLNVFKSRALGEDVPELKGYTIRRSLPGELPANTYGQFNTREGTVLINPNVKNSEYLRGAIGHETGHAVSKATDDLSRLGASGPFKEKQLDEALQDLHKYMPGLVDPDEKARHMALAWRLRLAKERQPMDLYFRDVGEAHGRASEAVAKIPGLEPYSHPVVTQRFGGRRPVYDQNEFARAMNENSVVESDDMSSIVRKLKQIVGAP